HLSGPEQESRGEVYSCANDRFQAGKTFNEMEALVRGHKWLDLRTNISTFKKEIQDLPSGSFYAALTSEVKTKMGLNPSFVVYDELGQARDRNLFDAMDSAMGARREPLMLVISTQAANDLAPMSQLIDYGLRIKNQEVVDHSFHLTLFAADIDDDPWRESTWKKANPALDDFRSLSDVRRMSNQAQRMPARENSFRNLILNQRVASEARFVDMSSWKACGAAPQIPVGAHVYAGLDLGHTSDLSALVLAYEDPVSSELSVVPYVWIPGDVKNRSDLDGAPYEAWVKSEQIIPIGEATDPRVIARKIAQINGTEHPIRHIAFDRWRVPELKRALDDIGCPVQLQPFGQGFKDMTPAVDVVERGIVTRKLRHGNHPVLAMCAANAVVTKDPAGGRKFDKSKSGGKIDALVAMAMALSAATLKGNLPTEIDIDALIG
ncbi:MAG TPA: terminase TerL endonuclease subunit, partial [Myxococcaceae bacterium]